MMRHRIFVSLIMMLSTIFFYGCQTTENSLSFTTHTPLQKQILDDARMKLVIPDEAGAKLALRQVVAAAPLPGVTDEALLRLAIFSLQDENGSAIALLDRLNKEFPTSIWSRQGEPLRRYLAQLKTLKDRQRELATLKQLNLSLQKDNRELKQTLERLKTLDLELEQKIRR